MCNFHVLSHLLFIYICKLHWKENGLGGLTDTEKSKYIVDPKGFISITQNPGFTKYTDRIIVPAYEKLAENGILSKSITPETYFAYRIFEDEAVAAKIALSSSRDTTTIVLLGQGKVKFGFGVQERVERNLMIKYQDSQSTPVDVLSILLNPSALDSESLTSQLQLSLGYGPFLKDQRPLANYLWFSKYPPVNILTRMKNPINAEGEKPPGESSVIGAF